MGQFCCEKTLGSFAAKMLHFSIFLDFNWTWTLHSKNLLDCDWTWTGF